MLDLVKDLQGRQFARKLLAEHLLALGDVLGVVGARAIWRIGRVAKDGDFLADLLDEVEELENAHDSVVDAFLATTQRFRQRLVGIALGGRHRGPVQGVFA